MKTDYVIITSAYNEEQNILLCLKSILKQTILPKEWIIVNDGSTDSTRTIIEEFIVDYSWIKLIDKRKEEIEFGAHAVVNFYIGVTNLSFTKYDYIVQLDADISIDRSDYFEYQLRQFDSDPKLGISSGITYSTRIGKKILTKRMYWRTGGATKMYRKQCLTDIGGLKPIFSWDGLDVYQAMYKGWKSRTFFDLQVNHLGKKRMLDRYNQKHLLKIKGAAWYKRGYPIEFVFLKFLQYTYKKGWEFGVSFIGGYLQAKKNKMKKYVTKEEKSFIRKVQYIRILDHFSKRQLL